MRITARAPRAILLTFATLMLILMGQTQPMAQQLPGPRIDMESVDLEDISVNFDDSFNAIDSPYLSGALLLNYQISLLEKMNERQATLLKISDSFAAMGLPFEEPAPARGLCEQLPPNAPCLKHYPELYQVLVDSRKAFYAEQNKKMATGAMIDPNDPAAVERARKAKEEQERRLAEAKAKAAALERATRYQWTDVKCAAGICTGVVIRPKEAGYRATVQKGARLGDGTLITDIHLHGISAVIDGDRIDLRPAPGEADGAATATGTATTGTDNDGLPDSIVIPNEAAASGSGNNTASTAQSASGQSGSGSSGSSGNLTTANNASAAQIPTPQPPSGDNGGTSTVQPTLGPSGLF
jgi:hypothetical protein